MIEPFIFTDAQWHAIREQVLDDLAVDTDQITNLRERIEVAVGMYRYRDARPRPRRDELTALREDAVNMQVGIMDALTVRVSNSQLPRGGVDAGMTTATRNYFTKLFDNLDRQIAQCASSRDNARKPDRDQCWDELLAIWCDIGGKPHGVAAAEFVKLASLPVMNGGTPFVASIRRWLERRRG